MSVFIDRGKVLKNVDEAIEPVRKPAFFILSFLPRHSIGKHVVRAKLASSKRSFCLGGLYCWRTLLQFSGSNPWRLEEDEERQLDADLSGHIGFHAAFFT